MPVVTISGTSGANAVTISTAGIYSVNLGSGDDTLYDNVSTIITAHGGVGNDSLSVTESTGLIYGDSGNDTISATYGAYTVYGGNGNDSIIGSEDGAIIYGQAGSDTITVEDGKYTI